MKFKLTANFLQEADNVWTAWINEIRGVVAQGESLQEVRDELLRVFRVKLEVEREEQKKRMVSLCDNITTEEFNCCTV
jgi:predicted RNase H-like HicB family nuclease